MHTLEELDQGPLREDNARVVPIHHACQDALRRDVRLCLLLKYLPMPADQSFSLLMSITSVGVNLSCQSHSALISGTFAGARAQDLRRGHLRWYS